jgi:nucleotide-binding universal stress UspA family protein
MSNPLEVRDMYETILVPTDGSAHSVRAAELGLELARAFDATVHVIHVVDVQAAAGPFSAGGVDEEFVARLESEGEQAIEAVETAIDGSDALRTAVVQGSPPEAILDYVDDHDVDLVAMGTAGRSGLERQRLGSTTAGVLRRSDVPVRTLSPTT